MPTLERKIDNLEKRFNKRFSKLEESVFFIKNAVTVILRELDNKADKKDFQDLDFKIAALDTRLDRVETRLSRVETRLSRVETRLSRVETRLDHVETRLEGVETRLDRVETRLDGVETKLDNVIKIHEPMLQDHGKRIGKLEASFSA